MLATQPFGNTGHISSRIILGGAAFWSAAQDDADAALALAFSYGLNHVDTAASYGVAEIRIGDWIKRHGKQFFLSTKTLERTAAKAREEIQRSLERLHVDRVDLLQLHYLVPPAEWETALGTDGALQAAVEARRQGLVRFIGVTGHGLAAPRMHLKSLERFSFDAVMAPLNYPLFQNAQYLGDFRALASFCKSRRVAVQTIKSLFHKPWGNDPHTRATWYRPLEEQADIDRAVHWVLGRPDVFLNTTGDVRVLPKILDAANRFQADPSEEAMQALVARLGMCPPWTPEKPG